MNYKEIGFRSGIEIHQQLDTNSKLFCKCRSKLSKEKPIGIVIRKLRAVSGETGKTDIAASHEAERDRIFEYHVYRDESCLIELDEEPPHTINPEALKIGLLLATMLNCQIPDELHVMRKTVIDGSNTSGFQRTVIIGTNGWIATSRGKVGITNVLLEEDSCQIIEKTKEKVKYGLDRLGIPMLEIGTTADGQDAEHTQEIAEKLGMILRSTGKVMRGLGTIRQDINVSIRGGTRIEIKGAQDLKEIPKIVDNEIKRQQDIIKSGKKVVPEVRRVKPDFKTEFMRPLAGSARLYPETDVQPVKITKELLDEVKKNIPELWEDKLGRFVTKYKLDKSLAENLLRIGKADLFENIVKLGFDKNLALRAITGMAKDLDISDDLILEVFKKSDKNISKEALQNVFETASKSGKVEIQKGLSDEDLRKIVKSVISKNKDALTKHNPIGILMGEVMKEVRGKADGKKIAELLKEETK